MIPNWESSVKNLPICWLLLKRGFQLLLKKYMIPMKLLKNWKKIMIMTWTRRHCSVQGYLDMFVMDLDRHEGQWNWGATDNANGKGKTYFPIPKDRDQAFYINQGLLPGFVKGRSLVPQLEGFKPAAKSITRFNFAARNLDRFFLNQLTEQDWKSAAEKFVSQMTDEVIDRAMAYATFRNTIIFQQVKLQKH